MPFLLRILKERWLLYIGLAAMAIGLPLSRALISIAPGILIGAWVIDGLYAGDFAVKWRAFKSNRAALSLVVLFLLYLIASLWSANTSDALAIVADKLPLLFAALVFADWGRISQRDQRIILMIHSLAVLLSIGLSYANFCSLPVGTDPREAVLLVNHIRLSIMMVLSIMLVAYLSLGRALWMKLASLAYVLLMLYFMAVFQMGTGLALSFILMLFVAIWALSKGGFLRLAGIVMLGVIVLVLVQVYQVARLQFDKPAMPTETAQVLSLAGEPYQFFPENTYTENGHYVWQYIALNELRETWNERSELKIGSDLADQQLTEGRLIRYLSSLGLRKDREAVLSLSEQDIANIEQGYASIAHVGAKGPRHRLSLLFGELDDYSNGANPSLSSLTIRWEYWRTALAIIKDYPYLGTGTGDVRDMFKAYQAREGRIDEHAFDKAHNQYLNWAATFGLIGGVLALLAFLSPWCWSLRGPYTRAVAIMYIVFLLSFLTEDTLENQLGLNLFLFFLSLFVLPYPKTSSA